MAQGELGKASVLPASGLGREAFLRARPGLTELPGGSAPGRGLALACAVRQRGPRAPAEESCDVRSLEPHPVSSVRRRGACPRAQGWSHGEASAGWPWPLALVWVVPLPTAFHFVLGGDRVFETERRSWVCVSLFIPFLATFAEGSGRRDAGREELREKGLGSSAFSAERGGSSLFPVRVARPVRASRTAGLGTGTVMRARADPA